MKTGIEELKALNKRLGIMLEQPEPGFAFWRSTLSELLLDMADYAGCGSFRAMLENRHKQTKINPIYLVHHLGLGDAIILNAAVRLIADFSRSVTLPVKPHNLNSVAFMYRDLHNVIFQPVVDDIAMLKAAASAYARMEREAGTDAFSCGVFGRGFNLQRWDQSFYDQLGIPFEARWNGWKVERDTSTEIQPPAEPFLFVHDDPSRGLNIKPTWVEGSRIIMPHRTPDIFQWWAVLEAAAEIHCISSSFALFADSIALPNNPRLFLHAYARPGEPLPQFRKPWEIIK